MNEFRVCKRCLLFNNNYYNSNKNSCKECLKKKSKQRYDQNKDKILQQERKRRESAERKEYCKQYWIKNKKILTTKRKEYTKQYYILNKERKKEYQLKNTKKRLEYHKIYNQKHYQKNKQKYINKSRKRRDLNCILDKNFSTKDRNLVFSKFDNKCFKCKSKDNLHIDHHVPLSKGRGLSLNNAVLLCRKCNLLKGSKLPINFYTSSELAHLSKMDIIHDK